jgi:hypothetical protein
MKKGCVDMKLTSFRKIKIKIKIISLKKIPRTFQATAMTTQYMRINSTSPLWPNSYDSTRDNGITLLPFVLNSLAVLMVNFFKF